MGLEKAKSQATDIVEILRKHHFIFDTRHASKIESCCKTIGIATNHHGKQKLRPLSCGSPLCPVCQYFDIRKECGITRQLFDDNIKIDNYKFYFITLTIRHCKVNKVLENIDMIRSAFDKLRKSTYWNRNVTGDSVFFHFGINDNEYVQPHLHILAMANHELDADTLTRDWAKYLSTDYYPEVDIKEVNIPIRKEAVNIVSYGMKMVKHKDIIKYPKTYLILINQIRIKKPIRLRFHHGLLYKGRSNVRKNYAKRKDNGDINDQNIQVMKYKGKRYHKDRVITY